ncbi:MAG: protein kinase family protein [Streptosporangiaceae bacterium]
MSTFTSDPGTRLAGRYRLEDRLAEAGGWSAWRAIDEILARPVSVITFASGFPRLAQVVTAARAASRLTDTRLTQVFDVEDSWDHGYIVLEWPVGDSLADLLSEGSIEPHAAARIVAEAAAALAGAHAAGLAHLCLRPDAVRWTAGGGVKVTGLGIDAALSGVTADDPELADTRGLGQLLYAALTGLWPGPDSPELPPAPRPDGELARPGMVRAGVPPGLDEVAGRALALPGFDSQAAYQSPAELAAALSAAIPPVQLPTAAMQHGRRDADRTRTGWSQVPSAGRHFEAQPARSLPPPSSRRSPARVAAVSALVLVAVAGASAAAVHLLNRSPSPATAGRSPGVTSSPSHQATPIKLVSASGFDALNPSNDPGDENSNQAANVLDGNPAGWSTQQYDGSSSGSWPTFGDLKAGTGFILDLGRPSRVRSVTVTFGTAPGADVEIKLGDSNTRSAANLDAMTTVASASNVSGSYTFTTRASVTDRYLVIWFTKLPQMAGSPGKYGAQIFSVVVRGTS